MGATEAVQQVIRETITTGTLASGGLLPTEVADAFLTEFETQTEFSQLLSWRPVDNPSGKMSKLAVGSRLLRKMEEDVGPAETQAPTTSEVSYACEEARLDYEITEKTIRQNIAKEGFETLVFQGMSNAYALDIVDLAWNGDTATLPGATDAKFLSLNDGWLKLLPLGGAAALNGATINGGDVSTEHVYEMLDLLSDKWAKRLGQFRLIMNPRVRYRLAKYMSRRGTALGDVYSQMSQIGDVAGVQIVSDENLPTTKIVLVIPAHLAIAISRQMTMRYTTTSDEAVRRDKRIYAMFAEFDPICLWPDACVICSGLNA